MPSSRSGSPPHKRARASLPRPAEGVETQSSPPARPAPSDSRWALTWNNHPNEALRQATLSPRDDYPDMLTYQQAIIPSIESLFNAQLEGYGPFKAKATVSIWLSKGDTEECFGFTSGAFNGNTDTLVPVVSPAVVGAQLVAIFAEISRRVDEFLHLGSGWTIAAISWLEVRMVSYAALGHTLTAGGSSSTEDNEPAGDGADEDEPAGDGTDDEASDSKDDDS